MAETKATETKAETKAEETKAETKAEAKTAKHKVPAGHITPVELTKKLKETVNPATGKPYAEEKLSSQQVYTYLKAAETNGMPVKHFTADGTAHKAPQKDENDQVVSRPGFDEAEAFEWWANRPVRGAKKAETAKSEEGGASEEEDGEASDGDELEEDDELEDDDDEDDEEGALVDEAE
jgi:hypothetical protein